MAVSAGIVLHKSQLYDAALRNERKSNALMQLVKVSSGEYGSIHMVINKVISVAYKALYCDRVTLYFVDTLKECLYCMVSKDEEGWNLPLGKGIAGFVGKTGEMVNIGNAYEDDRFDDSFDQASGYRTQSVICYPVTNDDNRPIAVLQAINKKDAETAHIISFSEEDEELCETLCAELKTLIRRYMTDALLEHTPLDPSLISLMDMYNRKSYKDPLKNLGNSRTTKIDTDVRAQTYRQSFVWPDLSASLLSSSSLNSMDFNVWSHNEDDLLGFCFEIFSEMNLLKEFNIKEQTLQNFFIRVRNGYRKNPFHNWHHGFSVLHFSYLQLRCTDALNFLTSIEVLSLLIASLCHDIDHPGNTNSFEVNNESDLALIHNGVSVLENHHAYTTFLLMRDSSCNILESQPLDSRMAIKSTIVSAILATDMTSHFSSVKRLDGRDEPFFDCTNEDDRRDIVTTLIHSADLSGQVFRFSVAKVWEERISLEFIEQAEKEEKLGLPVLPFMQNLSDPTVRIQNQINFIEFVLVPWWRSVARVFPDLRVCYERLLENRMKYSDQLRRSPLAKEKGEDGLGTNKGKGDEEEEEKKVKEKSQASEDMTLPSSSPSSYRAHSNTSSLRPPSPLSRHISSPPHHELSDSSSSSAFEDDLSESSL